MILKNKKGDISITILVLGIMAIFSIALFTIYSLDKKQSKNLDDFIYLRQVYVEADSLKYSMKIDTELYQKYKGIEFRDEGLFINREFENIKIEYLVE